METKLSNIHLSTVVPGNMTPENTTHHLTNTDLAMKLHYIKGVYFFKKEAVEGLTISELKAALFDLLNLHYPVAGRIRRRPEDGRPFVKCNDSGVRIMEAEANATVDEWVDMNWDIRQLAFNDHVLGPDLEFSPLVFLQFTWFKCGGFSIGLSWAHIIGDAFSALTFINMFSEIIKGKTPFQNLILMDRSKTEVRVHPSSTKKPASLNSVDSVGNYWMNGNDIDMVTFSLHISSKKVDQITSKTKAKPFQAISAIIWKSLAKVRGESEAKIVTICDCDSQNKRMGVKGNGQSISTIVADFIVSNASVLDLADVIASKTVDETNLIEKLIEEENNLDVILYGANLTFVNLEGARLNELEIKGHKPFFTNYTMAGVGDKGTILVIQGPENDGRRLVTVILPSDQVVSLRNELKNEWGIVNDKIMTKGMDC